MKKLYLIGGTMGVGKTTVCQHLKKLLPNAVFLDGDWRWDADPFQVTDETREMVIRNICFLLDNFLRCSCRKENIIFCWVMRERGIINAIIRRINTEDCAVKTISLRASKETPTGRILKDVSERRREADALERSIARLPLYPSLKSVTLHTDGKMPLDIAEEIMPL